jgi:hypothetical protein
LSRSEIKSTNFKQPMLSAVRNYVLYTNNNHIQCIRTSISKYLSSGISGEVTGVGSA